MDYFALKIETTTEIGEILMAFLPDYSFDTFEEHETGIIAYIPTKDWNITVENYLKDLQKTYPFTFEKEFIPYKNWNAEWEANFKPVIVDEFCAVRASFHPTTPNVKYDLVIDPKMAFGTGHHETTYMMMARMQTIDFQNKKVLDYGCGTGILAILASKLSASSIDAVDIEIESYDNTINNSIINSVHNINALHGDLSVISSKNYDIVLANINRNVILNSLQSLYEMMNQESLLIVSGCMLADESIVIDAAQQTGFQHQSTLKRNNWLCISLKK